MKTNHAPAIVGLVAIAGITAAAFLGNVLAFLSWLFCFFVASFLAFERKKSTDFIKLIQTLQGEYRKLEKELQDLRNG